ncbi:3-deoxy-7-phosphoheptulonate synthase [Streptomyces puniciscabiei]
MSSSPSRSAEAVTELATRAAREPLASLGEGRGFVVQMGGCAETFAPVTLPALVARVRRLHHAVAAVSAPLGLPVIPVGRSAGQFAKPRSSPGEQVGDRTLPSCRGDLVNDRAPTGEARQADPNRMLRGHPVMPPAPSRSCASGAASP